MSDNTYRFNLSPQGTLRWTIASLLLASHLPLAVADGITVVEGPGGIPILQNQGGVPIVNIVAPNTGGLSHNQFLDYNVGQQGVVLNNALQAGQSQLAGQLAANQQLHGQAASVILNEVISRNASQLNGAQEIFGRAADFVLANPNGISVNGGSFINTPNASLVVGRPELQDGKLQGLNTQDTRGQLDIHGGGLRNAEGSINLIAPRIDSKGELTALDQLNVTVGRNQLDYPTGKVLSVDPSSLTQEQRIDASLFGAMQAGRINIVSTAEGAGVRVGAVQVDGRDGVKLSSAGDLDIRGEAVANSLDATRAGVRSQGDIELHGAKDLTLAATDVSGRNVKLDAGRNLTLSAIESRKLQEKREQWDNSTIGITWETYDRTESDSDSRQHGTKVVAQNDAVLNSGAETEIQGSNVKAHNRLSADSKGDLSLTAATETHTQSDQGKHRKHLWKENWDSASSEQRTVASQLQGDKQLDLTSKQKLQLQGAELHSQGDITLAAQDVDINSASRQLSQNNQSYSGDLVGGGFFGKNADGDQGKTENQGSKVNADGKLIVRAASVRISGSQARGGTEASVISEQGSLTIDGLQDTSHSNSNSNDSKFFGIAKDESHQQHKDKTTVSSQLRSDSNLTLKSAEDLNVSGSQVTAQGDLKVSAKGTVKVVAGENTQHNSTSTQVRGLETYAKENAADTDQYRAGVHYQDKQQNESTTRTQQQASSLTGGTLTVKADEDLRIESSALKATAGAANLSGKNVQLLASDHTQEKHSDTTTTGGGFYYTGGIERAGNGIEVAHNKTQDSSSKSTAQTSNIEAKGNLTINADNRLSTEGAKVKAQGTLLVNATEIDNKAARNSETSDHKENNWRVDVGANVEYKGLTKPVAKAIQDIAQGNFDELSSFDDLEQPNAGLDIDIGHQNRQLNESSNTAVVSQLSGSQVEVNATGQMSDQGTQYQATDGALKISARSLQASATSNTQHRSEQSVDATVGVRVYTNTLNDVSIRGSGAGGSSNVTSSTETAQVGSYAGSQGVNIDLKGDGRFEGSQFDGKLGGVSIKTGGELALEQANDRKSSSESSVTGNASLSFGLKPGANEKDFNLGASLQLDHKANNQQDTQARIASIQGQGPVELTSISNLTLQGTQIGNAEHPTGDISLNAGGKLDLQAAVDTHSSNASNLGGGFTAGGGKTSGEESSSKNVNFSANFNIGQGAENDQTQHGSTLYSNGQVLLKSNAKGDNAIHLQGTQIEAPEVTLTATQGGIYQESAQSTQSHSNWGVDLGGGIKLGKTTMADALAHDSPKVDLGTNASAKVDVDFTQGVTQHNSVIKANQVTLNSADDVYLAGARIDAQQVNGAIIGDLKVLSRQDHLNSTQVNFDAKLEVEKNQPGLVNKITGATGPLEDTLQAKAEEAFQSNREKLENAVDTGVDKLGSAKDSLVAKASDAKERLGEKLSRSGSYDVNPEPRGAFGSGMDKTKNYLADKADAVGNSFSSLKERFWPKTSDSYSVSENTTTGSKVANTAEEVLFGDKSGTTSYTPSLNLNVSHESKNRVEQASGINAQQGINLQVGGETQLTGARIGASEGRVELGGSKVTSTALAGSDYRANVGLNLSTSQLTQITGSIKELTRNQDEATQKDQLFNVGPLRLGGHSDSQLLQAGIDQKIP
ncbi:hemagglutinin repeat-containing protein [Pseudomonas rubra]|uniref:Hemagglutinin repeat-containing protein n=1 Tax=Pseudomonas rubra TaxID=2942627 RepID=A0ABT5PDF0_9PSED|nr:hemagglutinin repeat-containing protein [Pseudomonas rubra]MDD1016221.1 hemagglutinin repeat-containing protein [Pseudomonas rubra]MDD1039856.1 hemagglutinin repeat-containing protein [Pseudomonas rubra]MDD1156155.1 hemagglutinin repeat-containing protein [Pseudomonas rubra]